MATILVVDDDPAARKPLVRLLQGRGYTVVAAADATVALASASSSRPDLILLDVAIPRLDGLTMLWRLRETSAGRGIPVIVVTGHEEPETIQRAQELGVKEYLVKSRFSPADLLDLVRQYTAPAPASPASDTPTTTSAS